MEERKKKRSHEEVVAAREAYLKAKAERKAARDQQAKERAERKAAREKLKKMSSGERAQLRYEAKLEGLQRKRKKDQELSWYEKLPIYTGDVQIGEIYTVKFAGGLERGKLVEIGKPGMDCARCGQEDFALYVIRNEQQGREYFFPVRREAIVAEGYWYRPENEEQSE